MTRRSIHVGLVGMGKIARDQHIPVLADSPDFELIAVASRTAADLPYPTFRSLQDMLVDAPSIDAVALCMPPQARPAIARAAIAAGKHVLMEKPPTDSVAAAQDLARLASEAGVSLFAMWHSRHAPAIDAACSWAREHEISHVDIVWKEDVRRWHPGQDWIWEPGGFGVFDPGINALSILTKILAHPVTVDTCDLLFPANKDAPIAATLALSASNGATVSGQFDFRETGPQIWDLRLRATNGEELLLRDGGATIAGASAVTGHALGSEYGSIYAQFARLIRSGQSDVDITPLVLVADAFLKGRRVVVEPFVDTAAQIQ